MEENRLTEEQFEDRLKSLLRLQELKDMEARKWHAREKQNEFRWGDSNTSYFHRIANARKKRNTIAKIEVEGVECFDFPTIDEVERNEMEKDFTEEEVYEVVKHFGTNKSPGPNGFSMEFYKYCWPIIKIDFMRLMSEFFRYGSWDWRLNCSFISLIPKKEDSCTPKDYRPLSLLGSAYKVLYKVLENRMKSVMNKLVSDFQGEFVKEILSKLVDDAVGRNQIHGFQVVEGGTMISHLQFADDTLLFVNATEDEIRKLLLILNYFELLTGMKLNLDKSTLISVGADDVVGSLAMELGCRVEKLPIKYLGFPIGATVRCTSVWDEVIKRMEVKLASWKKKFLSKDGRLVLIRSFLASLPIYFISLIHMPVSVEKKLNQLMRRFLRDSNEDRRKMSWVSWLKICNPKKLGGLGVKDLSSTSKALKEKWIWRYPAVFKVCSMKNASITDMVEDGRLYCNFRRRLFMQERMEWDLLCNELGPVHGLVEEEDSVEIMSEFTVKKCYEQLVQDDTTCDFNKFLWKQGIPPKVSFICWATFHDSLPTLSMLRHRGMDIQDDKCPFCKEEEETTYHIFVSCSFAFEVWSHFVKAFRIAWVFPNSVKANFEAWRMNNSKGKSKEVWWKVIYVVQWHLWNARNKIVFGGRAMTVEEVILLIKQSIIL
ncbi:uncharacterized protein LOC113272539 [Papaver somniferum]|uniref:uncharacterized protein LOC113272539 n=1 Tax=Papaver somniferum TaxID=3469 RepID=UPI000E705140|nr:uncharacterized protein LOC113272539 [Papaver somniferum]